jgi:MFS family permease
LTAAEALTAAPPYRRDAMTWAAFSGLLAFGVLNALLGPALPYLRASEHISYLASSFHQVAYAIGGGLAGLIAVRTESYLGRGTTIRLGLVCAAIAALGIGYGDTVAITVPSAFLVSLFGTSALIRVWAALADVHGERRTVAMAEGEVSVSLGGIVAPLLVGALAATTLSWRFSFVAGGLIVLAAAAAMGTVRIPPPTTRPRAEGRRFVLMPTLVIVLAIVALEFSLSFWLASYLDDTVGLGRETAVVMVSGLYAANLVGRVVASHLARSTTTERLLAVSLITGMIGTGILLAAGGRRRGGRRHRRGRDGRRRDVPADLVAARRRELAQRRRRDRAGALGRGDRADHGSARGRRDRAGRRAARRAARRPGHDPPRRRGAAAPRALGLAALPLRDAIRARVVALRRA